ncbi:hypothetical protein KEM55_002065, partial [Ascosphaera atra]
IFSIDDSYQLACLLHLYRRVFGKSQLDSAVRSTVNELMRTLENVGRGGSAEACVLFPIFTVGCETTDLMHRQTVIDRVFSFEHLGLKQVREARKLMQRAWEKNLPWTDLTNGEFLGSGEALQNQVEVVRASLVIRVKQTSTREASLTAPIVPVPV